MKSQRGVTLISLTVYIIVMTIVIGVVSLISSYFYSNTRSLNSTIDPLTQYTKFNSFFSEEVNSQNIKVLQCKENFVVFDNGTQYTYVAQNKGIYKNQVKICMDVESCTFNYSIKNGKPIVSVKIKMKDAVERSVDYTLKN